MPIQVPTDGHGATLTFAGFAANIIKISGGGATRPEIEITHLGTTVSKQYIPAKLIEMEDVTAEIEFDPQAYLPIDGAIGTLTITWADAGGAIWAWASAFVKGAPVGGAATGERMTASVTWRVNGKPTITP